MRGKLRRSLEKKRKEAVQAAVCEALAAEAADDLQSGIAKIETYSKLLSASEPGRSHDWIWAGAIGALCVTLAGVMWSVKVPRTDVSAVVNTSSFTTRLTTRWRIDSAFASGAMHVERLSTINAPNLGFDFAESSGDSWFKLEGGNIALQTLAIGEHASLEIVGEKNEVNIYISRAPFSGEVIVTGKVRVTAGPTAGRTSVDRSYEIEIPETVVFSAEDPRGIPSELSIHSPGNWSLGRPQLSEMRFAREEVRGAANRVTSSAIQSGTVRFHDTSWAPIDLHEGDLLALDHTEKASIETRGEPGVIHVLLNGVVGDVTVGDPETRSRLAPSYLEYFYNKKSLGFVWSAILFFWGVIWSIRKTIFR
jgi:hypothetical protein